MLLTLELFRLQGLVECGEASAADKLLLRILTPITKLYTAKQVHTCTQHCVFTEIRKAQTPCVLILIGMFYRP